MPASMPMAIRRWTGPASLAAAGIRTDTTSALVQGERLLSRRRLQWDPPALQRTELERACSLMRIVDDEATGLEDSRGPVLAGPLRSRTTNGIASGPRSLHTWTRASLLSV